MARRSAQGAQCSIERALSVVGERWNLLILREIFQGRDRFGAIRTGLGISRNVLSARLEHLIQHRVLQKVSYQDHPVRYQYRLTTRGVELYPVLLALLGWGDRWLTPEGEQPPLALVHTACGSPVPPDLCCPGCGEALTPSNTRARLSAARLARPASR